MNFRLKEIKTEDLPGSKSPSGLKTDKITAIYGSCDITQVFGSPRPVC
jgi:hypothetical protein